jgi:hypothetical protein
MQLDPGAVRSSSNVVPGRERIGAEVQGELEQVLELDPLVAANAGDGRASGGVAVGEILNHRRPETLLEVEHVMRDVETLGDQARVPDVLAGAAGALAPEGAPVVVELERDTDHLIAGLGEQRGRARAVDAARHRDHDPAFCWRAADSQRVQRLKHREVAEAQPSAGRWRIKPSSSSVTLI